MKSIIQMGIIPARTQSHTRQEIFKPVDHVKYESGQVTTFVVCAVFSLSVQAVELLTKTAINHRFFCNLV